MIEGNQDVRNNQRVTWTRAAPEWVANRDDVAGPTVPITEQMIELSQPREGERVLDLACGVGDPAFSFARLVGDTGFVLGLDITEAMVVGAQLFAKQNGVTNVEFRTIASELHLGVPYDSFDICSCRHGLMFMPSPDLAMKSLVTAARPGGRITISTWGARDKSPVFTLPSEIIRRHVELPERRQAKGPGLFALPTADAHARLFDDAGLRQVATVRFDCPVMVKESPAAMWDHVCVMGGPLAKVIRNLEAPRRDAVRKDFIQTLTAMFPSGKVILTAEVLVTTGVKPY